MKKERFKLVSAVYLVLIQDGKLLMLRRANTGYEDGNYSLPAGHMDGNETAREAMVREADEEIDIHIDQDDMEVVHVLHRYCPDNEYIDFYISPKKWSGEIINKEPDKCDDLSWFSLDNLPKNTIPFVQEVITHIQEGRTYSESGW